MLDVDLARVEGNPKKIVPPKILFLAEERTIKQKQSAANDWPGPALLKAPFSKEQAEHARAEWAKHLQIPERKTIDLGRGAMLELVLIPPGEFTMGSTPAERETAGKTQRPAEDRPLANEESRQVTISRPFYMAITETTQEQYQAVTLLNPSGFSPIGANKKQVAGVDTSKFPVERVTWNNAAMFAIGSRQVACLPRLSGNTLAICSGNDVGLFVRRRSQWKRRQLQWRSSVRDQLKGADSRQNRSGDPALGQSLRNLRNARKRPGMVLRLLR